MRWQPTKESHRSSCKNAPHRHTSFRNSMMAHHPLRSRRYTSRTLRPSPPGFRLCLHKRYIQAPFQSPILNLVNLAPTIAAGKWRAVRIIMAFPRIIHVCRRFGAVWARLIRPFTGSTIMTIQSTFTTCHAQILDETNQLDNRKTYLMCINVLGQSLCERG